MECDIVRKISRNIYTKYTYDSGELYALRVRSKNLGVFLTVEMAEEARLDFDFEKEKWYCYTKKCLTKIPPNVEINSKLVLHNSGKWYAKLEYLDDIIVSDLYTTKKEAQDVKQFLDKERWSIQALNTQKWEKSTCSRKYAGILPTKIGYLVMGVDKKEYGVFQNLEDALNKRNELRSRGVII